MTPLRVLVVTNMWPGERSPYFGIFVQQQVEALRRVAPDWTFDVLTIGGYRGRGDYVRAVPRVRRQLQEGYDVVHAHYGFTGVTVALADRRTPLVLTLHGGDANLAWQRWITKPAQRRAARVIAVSARLRERSGDADAVVLPCGVPLDLFRPMDRAAARERLGIPADAFVVLFPADPLNPVKDYGLFEAAMTHLPGELVARRRVLTLGGLAPADVPERMSAADVVVLTSLSEGSPMVVKEALACGVPVVSVDVGDVGEVLEGLPGCAVVPRDAGAIAAAAARAARAMPAGAEARRARVRELGLDGDEIARKLLAIYTEVAAGR